ncbi:hypothetical protein NECID01_1486 [Nematocida sp. AWRm77]|nr:hypothetical protein NECID01_1486 [Nematocida sp. AWRm77]
MRKIPALAVGLFAIAAVHCVHISITFKLLDGSEIQREIPEGMSKTIDRQKAYRPVPSDTKSDVEKAMEAPANNSLTLEYLDNVPEFEHLEAMWMSDLSKASSKEHQKDLSLDQFMCFLLTTDYLDIQGKYTKHFATNMVKYGLLGAHSADILASALDSHISLPYSAFWQMLLAFLEQARFQTHIVSHPSNDKSTLFIGSPTQDSSRLKEKYTAMPQPEKVRIVLYSKLGIEEHVHRTNEKVLGWILTNLKHTTVDIRYDVFISSGSDGHSAPPIQHIFQESKKLEESDSAYIEGIKLSLNYFSAWNSLPCLSQIFSRLSFLEIANQTGGSAEEGQIVSMMSRNASLWKNLKMLKITGQSFTASSLCSFLEILPSLESLSLLCRKLDPGFEASFSKCPNLVYLSMGGKKQQSIVLENLIKNTPGLKNLEIQCEILEDSAADKFAQCPQMEKLQILGKSQRSTFLQKLLQSTPGLKKLTVMCNPLQASVAESFKNCLQLTVLYIYSPPQENSFTHSLLLHVPHIQELCITVNNIDLNLARALRACQALQYIELSGVYTSGFIHAMFQEPLSTALKTLKIYKTNINRETTEDDKEAIQKAQSNGISVLNQ